MASDSRVVVRGARLFTGLSDELTAPCSVLIEGNTIARIGDVGVDVADALVLDAQGHTLMPGFIAAHEHLAVMSSHVGRSCVTTRSDR